MKILLQLILKYFAFRKVHRVPYAIIKLRKYLQVLSNPATYRCNSVSQKQAMHRESSLVVQITHSSLTKA